MAAIPEDVQVLFEVPSDSASSEGSSVDSGTTSSETSNIDYHQKAYPAYEPPARRGHNIQPGDKFINFKNRDPRKGPDPDKVEGVDNDKYLKLKLPVPFALSNDKLAKLKADFKGFYFHVRDNGNHDHQFSHVVTMIGTRLLQRRIKAGSKVLDVYGNQNACDRFNMTQVNAREPKSMKALCLRVGPADFIREVNKWGPYRDEAGDERFHRGTLGDMVRNGSIADYNVLQFVHTLYYQDWVELNEAMHAPGNHGTRVAYALVHRHEGNKGSLNDGEQVFVKKMHFTGIPLVKQTNVKTNSTYCHRDLTPMLFKEDKVWFPGNASEGKGLTWECHIVNDETWIIEIVPYEVYDKDRRDDIIDFNELWDMEEESERESGLFTPESEASKSAPGDLVRYEDDTVIIPTEDGKFVVAEIVNRELFETLRQFCVGKERNRKTLDAVVALAKHHNRPSAMFGEKNGMSCPEDRLFDHALAAYFVDLEREMWLMESTASMRPVLLQHASKLDSGPKYKDYSIRDLLSFLRSAVKVGRQVNAVMRSRDPVDRALEVFENQL